MKPLITALLLAIMVLFLSLPLVVTAQEGDITIHVVQRGENLFRIATQYGTTVAAISEANSITDPRYITVGQRLLIPNAHLNHPGAVITHMLKSGESLETLAYTYHMTVDQIVATNAITNPNQLYIGQELTVYQGESDPTAPMPRTLHHVRPGDNVLQVALAYQVPLNQLLALNALPRSAPLFPGQQLWIPDNGTPPALFDLPAPFTSYQLTPIPAIQGQTLGIHLSTIGTATLSGTFMSYPVQFVTHDATQHNAMFGMHAFAESGVYPLVVTVIEPGGIETTHTWRIRVDAGNYGSEAISLDTQQQDLLNPQVTEAEWERIVTMMSSFTSQRYFEGLMGLPATGAITSQFGTRRTYNGGVLNTFHSGTDFGSGAGAPILAPAAGIVILTENLPVRGNATIIDHGWGITTGYWHQSKIYVSVGDIVTPGQLIGEVGSTGRSTGPHLHWEMWVGGVQVDPMQWVQQRFF